MAEVRIEGFQETVDEALGDVNMAEGDDVEVLEVEDAPNGDDATPEVLQARTTFIEYDLRILTAEKSLTWDQLPQVSNNRALGRTRRRTNHPYGASGASHQVTFLCRSSVTIQ